MIIMWICSIVYFTGECVTEVMTWKHSAGIDEGKYHAFRLLENIGVYVLLSYLTVLALSYEALIWLNLAILNGLSWYELLWRKVAYGSWLVEKGVWQVKLFGKVFNVYHPPAKFWILILFVTTIVILWLSTSYPHKYFL